MQYDRRGLAVTSDSSAAVSALDTAVRSLLGHRRDAADHLERALHLDQGLALGHCLTGFSLLLLGRGELFAPARAAAARADAAMLDRGATAREARFVEALQHWLGGEMERAATTLETQLAAEPLDAFAFKLLQAIQFMLGDARGMRLAAASVKDAWHERVPEAGFIRGCFAFALEETGALDAAERAAQEALALEPSDVWAAHALAHVLETRQLPAAGIAWLTRFEGRRAGVNNFAAHIDWHLALFHLAQGDTATALALYDQRVRAAKTDDYRDVANAASLLFRLKQHGIDIGRRWEELADIAERRIEDRALVFAQLNYLLCLIGAGREEAAAKLLRALQDWSERGRGSEARIAAAIGVPLAQRLCGESHDAALITSEMLRPIGGSNVQRAIFGAVIAHRHHGCARGKGEAKPRILAA